MTTAPGADRRHPLRLLTFAIFVTASVLAWLGWSSYSSRLVTEERRQRDAQIEQLRSTMNDLNGRIAMAIRAAAATGDSEWIDQYRNDLARRHAALNDAFQWTKNRPAPPSIKRISALHQKLVENENQLLTYVTEDRLSEAEKVLSSPGYLESRKEYDDAVALYFAWLQAAEGAFPQPPDRTVVRIAAGFASVVFLMAGWCVVLMNTRRWRDELIIANERLAQQKAELEILNRTLDQRVAERTTELAESRETLARQAEELEHANAELTVEITRHRATEAALHREQYLLHALMNSIPDNIYFKDEEGRYLRINLAKATRSGLATPEEALGKTDFDFFPREHAIKALADERRVMESGSPLVGIEERLIWPDGAITWSSTTKSPFRDETGVIVGTLGVSRDITAQKSAEERLRETAERTRLILDNAREAFVGMDSKGNIIEWNAQAEAMFGRSRDEVLGRPVVDTIIPPVYRSDHLLGLARFLETGEGPVLNQRIEVSALNRQGVEFPVELSVTPLQLRGEWCFYAFLHDISVRKRNEAELRRAKDAAEAANRAKSDFLANMSHEIRTPMNAIIGMTDLVLDSELNDVQREYLQMVQSSGESLLTIINDILDYSKIEAGKLELAQTPFSLRRCVGDTMKSLAMRAHSKGLELAWRVIEPAPDHVIGDPDRLRQVLVNLVGNAIKFTETGEVVLEIACTRHSQGEAEFHFQVRDTGIGVPADKLSRIFEAFEQADNSSTRRYGGTGLGLTISTRLVEMMHGRVWVESEVGSGSVFHFTTRLQLVDETKPGPSPRASKALSQMRLLVVDDNATNRLILTELLHNWRIGAESADDASQAWRMLTHSVAEGRPFDLVLSDFNMPDHDGFELIGWMRRDEAHGKTPVIMLTSSDRLGDAALCRKLNVARRLTKPVKQSELLDAILEALHIEQADAAPEPETTSLSDDLPPLRILLVEDSLFNQKLAIGLLGRKGHHVTVADNGREALRQLEEGVFDVVLMDVRMPEMDGLAATAAIRQREKQTGGRLPIIAMTAHAMTGDREKCLEAGMDGYLSKPIRSNELFETLDAILRQQAGT